jgi:pre-mRNA-splicing factor ATP-dependent RNA helicase DHX38/PRP16
MDIAKSNTQDGFIKGGPCCLEYLNLEHLYASIAASAFGKFQEQFLSELHAEIRSYAKNEQEGHPSQPVQGIIVHDSDVLEPEPVRQGGLTRNGAVRFCIMRT